MAFSLYHQNRAAFYETIPDFWPDLYGEEYAVYDLAAMNQEDFTEIRQASDRIGRIFFKTGALLRTLPEETLLEMGYPEAAIPFILQKGPLAESLIARLDLARTEDGYKCIEINADTPTFIKECFFVNGRACEEFGFRDPNESCESGLAEAVRTAIGASARMMHTPNPYTVFTAHLDNIEDRNTALYLQAISGVPSRFVPLEDLAIVENEGLFDEKGRKIDILYRQTFPVEMMIADADDDGNRIGEWMLELIKGGKLAVINPPSAFLLQNKAVQAVVWGLHEEGSAFFSQEEHSWIKAHFLPSYLEPDRFLEEGVPFVKKPVFGREGDTVEIYDGSGRLAEADSHSSYREYVSLYQEYAELPKHSFISEKGRQEGRILTGSFLINGKPSAVGFRVGGQITNNLSYFLPAGIK